jgi:hypothetical protein
VQQCPRGQVPRLGAADQERWSQCHVVDCVVMVDGGRAFDGTGYQSRLSHVFDSQHVLIGSHASASDT